MEFKQHVRYRKMYSSSENRLRTGFLCLQSLFCKNGERNVLKGESHLFVVNGICLLFQGRTFWSHQWFFILFKIFLKRQLMGSKWHRKMCDFKRVLRKKPLWEQVCSSCTWKAHPSFWPHCFSSPKGRRWFRIFPSTSAKPSLLINGLWGTNHVAFLTTDSSRDSL